MKLLMENFRIFSIQNNFEVLNESFKDKTILEEQYISEWMQMFDDELARIERSISEGAVGNWIDKATGKLSSAILSFIDRLVSAEVKFTSGIVKKIAGAISKAQQMLSKIESRFPKAYKFGRKILICAAALAGAAFLTGAGYLDPDGMQVAADQISVLSDTYESLSTTSPDAIESELLSNVSRALRGIAEMPGGDLSGGDLSDMVRQYVDRGDVDIAGAIQNAKEVLDSANNSPEETPAAGVLDNVMSNASNFFSGLVSSIGNSGSESAIGQLDAPVSEFLNALTQAPGGLNSGLPISSANLSDQNLQTIIDTLQNSPEVSDQLGFTGAELASWAREGAYGAGRTAQEWVDKLRPLYNLSKEASRQAGR